MEFVKRYWTQIAAQMEGVSLTTKALIAALVVILVMAASLLMLYAAGEEMQSLGLAGANSAEAITRLNGMGIDAKVEGGMILVPSGSQQQAYYLLAEGGLLGESPASALDRMFESSSPWETDKSRSQRANNARNRFLSGVIANINRVKSADVMVDPGRDGLGERHVPASALDRMFESSSPWETDKSRTQRSNNARNRFLSGVIANINRVKSADVMVDPGQDGIGKRHVPASAMVNIKTTTGPVDTEMADAVAALVSGAVARLDITKVTIVDARTGRRVEVSDPSNMLPSDALRVKRDIEERKRRDIENILDYIPGVRVGVNVLMDPVASRHELRTDYDEKDPIRREFTEDTSSRNIANAGEPGPRSNTGLSINSSGGAGKEQTSNITETEFYENKPVILRQETTLTGHQVKQINVAINVPRSFFVGLYKQQNPDSQDEPDDAALATLVDLQLAQIKDKVQVITLADVQGTVRADMVPDAPALMIAGGGSTISMMFDNGWAGPAGISLLALASLGLMLGMVRKATRPESLPSVEELAGVPPSLPSDEELIGEAEESEATMQGVELNEEDLKARRIAEQISDLIRADPAEASRLLGKWVTTGE